MNSLFDVFTAWAPFHKSVSHSEEITKVAKLLEDKSSDDISFTAIDIEGNLEKYVLGSLEGNSKFLMGYVNPGFYLAPYHFMVMDPNITEEEANQLYYDKGHPSNPRFWLEHAEEPFAEGDQEEGSPHPSFSSSNSRSESEDSTFNFSYRGSSYVADKSLGLIYSSSGDEEKVYDWSLVQNTFFASQNPELVGFMQEEAEPEDLEEVVEELPVVRKSAFHFAGDWAEDVYPMVKSLFPPPGSVLKVNKDTYGVVTSDYLVFTDKQGLSKSVEMFDNMFEGISLTQQEGITSSVLLSFIEDTFNLDMSSLESYIDQ